jgi:hypothetical protein
MLARTALSQWKQNQGLAVLWPYSKDRCDLDADLEYFPSSDLRGTFSFRFRRYTRVLRHMGELIRGVVRSQASTLL